MPPRTSPSPAPTEHLEHVDAMRPIAQAAVIATHALIFFAPLETSAVAGDFLTLTRFSRELFFFISALVLTVTYAPAASFDYRRFWRHRFLMTGLPYLTWTVIYYAFIHAVPVAGFPFYRVPWRYLVSASGLHDFVTLVGTGYYQLYFIVVLVQFYVVFPPLLKRLKRSRRWHVPALALAVCWQVALDEALRHHVLPFGFGGKLETRLILSYPVYLLGGMVVGLNYRAVHEWLVRHVRVVVGLALGFAAIALTLNALRSNGFVALVAPGSDVLAPVALVYNAGAILCVYLAGVALMKRRRRTRAAVASAADATLGIYLAQMLWIPMLVRLAARFHAFGGLAWPLKCVIVVVVVFAAGYVLTIVAKRTPLARWVTGRPRVPMFASRREANGALP